MQDFGSLKLLVALLGPSSPLLGPIWSQNGPQNGPKSGPKSAQKFVQKMDRKITPQMPVVGPKVAPKLVIAQHGEYTNPIQGNHII